MFLLLLNVKQDSCEYQFLQFLVWPDRESNSGQPFQLQTLYPRDYWSINLLNAHFNWKESGSSS